MSERTGQFTKRLGIMGGTFDPVHIGHLIIAEQAWFELKLDKVLFVPARVPPHKVNHPEADAEHRFKMVELAIEDNPAFDISRIELERSGPSFTVDTLDEIRKSEEDTELFLIVGGDTILEILTWRKPEKLIKLCRLAAVTRPGYHLKEAERVLPKAFLDRTVFIEAPGVQISATELRNRVRQGKPIMYLVPKPVEQYIIEKRLYR